MTIDNLKTVDAVVSPDGDTLILMMFDGWDWGDPYIHLITLQDKINLYFEFVESGQVYEEYPAFTGRRLRIDIIARLPLPDVGQAFLTQASAAAAELGITIHHRVVPVQDEG